MRSQKLTRSALWCASTALVFLGLSCAVEASTYKYYHNYGDYVGTHLTFDDVTEASLTNSEALYGAPSVSADSLFFNLEGVGAFNIRAENSGFDLVDGQLITSLIAHDGYGINSVTINEYGDYTLCGTGTSTTQVSATISALLRITEVNGVAVTPITTTLSDNASYDLATTGNKTDSWALSVNFDANDILAAESEALAAAGITDGLVTQATLTFDNSLFAISESTSGAFIAKKMADILVDTQPVPEPSTLVLATIGAVFCLGSMWRRNRRSTRTA